MASLARKLKRFNQDGMQGVKRATENENKPTHYVPGDSSSFTNNVRSRTFNPVSSGGGNYVPTATTPVSATPRNNYNYPSAQTGQPFNSKWSDELNAMYEQIKNKPKFSYDQSKDPLYQQYAAMYQKNAQLAMNDTMARASALTGGYGNSYAQTAGQQMYNQQMDQLNDKALDLYYAALDKYNSENDDMYKKFNLAGQMYGYDYDAWRDQMADSRWAQEFDYGAYRDSISDRRYDDETAYNRGIDARNYNYQLSRDAESDRRYNTEWEYQLDRDRVADERYADETAYNRAMDARDYNYQLSRDAVGDARYADETAYNRRQDDLSRALQYYQAGYDPSTGGRSVQSQLEYLAANGNTEGVKAYVNGLSGISKSQKDSLIKQYSGGNTQIEDNSTYELIVKGNTKTANDMMGVDYNRTGDKYKFGALVPSAFEKNSSLNKKYDSYEEYLDAALDKAKGLSEAEKTYILFQLTQ